MSGYYSGNDECEGSSDYSGDGQERVFAMQKKKKSAVKLEGPSVDSCAKAGFANTSTFWVLPRQIVKSELE